MNALRRPLVILFSCFAALTFSCHGLLTPETGPGTAYPCGIGGVECGGGACCPEYHVCGYDGPWSRCEPGYCCYDGPDMASRDAAADAGETRKVQQSRLR